MIPTFSTPFSNSRQEKDSKVTVSFYVLLGLPFHAIKIVAALL